MLNGHTLILEQAVGRDFLVAWGILLAAVLLILFWYVARKVQSRSAALILGGMILLATVGPFAAFLAYYIPSAAVRVERLNDKVALLELDSRKDRDIALAYRRENAALNQTLQNLRGRIRDLEERAAAGAAGPGDGEGAAAVAMEPARVSDRTASPGRPAAEEARDRTPAATSTEKPPEAMTQEERWIQPRASNARYHVKILAAESRAELARNLEKKLKHLRFQTDAPLFVQVSDSGVVYHSETDYRRAAYLVWLLQYRYKMDVPLRLSPDERHQGHLQIHLQP